MVKKTAIFFAYVFVFLFALIAFTPKESLYFFAEQKLEPFGVVIAQEQLQDKLFTLELEDATLYAQKIEAAKVSASQITLLGIYNSIEVEGVELASMVESFVPQKIAHISLRYSLVDPLNVVIEADGEFGDVNGAFSIVERKLELHLKPSKVMLEKYRSTLREFKKDQNGEYNYVKTL